MRQNYLYLLAFIFLLNLNAYGQNKKTKVKKLNSFGLALDQFLGARYETGVVILINGDTVSGAFEFNDSKENYQTLYYRDSKTLEKKVYEPRDIKYLFLDSLAFMPVDSKEDGLVLMRIILSDKLKVYFHKHYITTNTGSGVINQFYCIKPNGEQLIVSYDGVYPFTARVGNFFSDDPDLYKKITNHTYGSKEFYKIIEEYNDWLKKK